MKMKLSLLIRSHDEVEQPVTSRWLKYAKKKWETDAGSHTADGMFHPSQLAGCPAMLFLDQIKKAPKEPFDARLFRIFANGDGVHERIQVDLAKAGLLVTKLFDKTLEIPVHIPEYNIGGHTDGVLNFSTPIKTTRTLVMFGKEVPVYKHKDDSNRAILEIKSINDRGFKEVLKHGPKPEHIFQANIYCRALNIKKMVFIYENKDSQIWFEKCVPYNEKLFMEAANKATLVAKWVKEYRKTKVIPRAVYDAARQSAKSRRSWGQYAIDVLVPKIGQKSTL